MQEGHHANEHHASGDEGPGADFGTLVAAEVPGLFRYALALVRNRVEAEDLVDDTVVRALERQAQFRSEASLRTWLHQILHNLAVDRGRRHRREISVAEVEEQWRDDRYSVDAALVAERAAQRADLEEALEHLPFLYRTMVVLHDVEGWTVAEAAEVLGIELPAAKQRLRRGRMALVSILATGEERRMANRGVVLNCPEARHLVSEYIDDELDADRRSLLEAHLAGCATCPPLYRSLVGVKASLGSWHDPDTVVPPDLARRIRLRTEGH